MHLLIYFPYYDGQENNATLTITANMTHSDWNVTALNIRQQRGQISADCPQDSLLQNVVNL